MATRHVLEGPSGLVVCSFTHPSPYLAVFSVMRDAALILLVLTLWLPNLSAQGDDDPVIREYEQALKDLGINRLQRDPAFLRARRFWPQLQREVAAAIREQDKGLGGSPEEVEKLKTLYRSRLAQGRAVDHYLYGRLMGLLGDLDTAFLEFREALDIDRYFYWAWDGLGVYHSNKGQFDAAVEKFRTALRINPDFEKAAFGLAQALIQRGDFADAAKVLSDLVSDKHGRSPDPAAIQQARLMLAEVYRRQEDYPLCLDELSALEREGMDDQRVLGMKAFCCKRMGRWKDAAAEYRKIIARFPKEERYHRALADCLERMGRNADAADELEKALELGSESMTRADRQQLESLLAHLRRQPAVTDPKDRTLHLDDWVNRLLTSPDLEKRRQAMMFLSTAPNPAPSQSVNTLLKRGFSYAVKDPDPIIQAKALQQLTVRWGWSDKVRDLVELFVEKPYDRRVRGMAASLLKRWDDRTVVPVLILALQDEDDPYVFSQIHDSLNSLTLAWIERILPEDITPEVIAKNRRRWNDWYRRHRDRYRKAEPPDFDERWH
ncbi:MAG TPA: tetratricopeptide repeat protein [Planctomycetes bacterium]|nr:tetratricopeptide repeat protein [Planctomycetota bacterium]